jgi:hypothetical protein
MDKFVEFLVYFDIFRAIISIKAIVAKLHLCKLNQLAIPVNACDHVATGR